MSGKMFATLRAMDKYVAGAEERAAAFVVYSRYLRVQCRAFDQAERFERDSEQARFWRGVAMRQWELAAAISRVHHFDERPF